MKWMIDAGNSSVGPVGFTLYGINADSPEAALEVAKRAFGLGTGELHDRFTGEDGETRFELNVYFNADALTLENVYEDDMDSDDEQPAAADGGGR